MGRIHFTNRAGLELAGNVELPPGGAWRATVLFAHCFTCTRNIRAARDITRALAAEGFAVLRFDFTGLGESDGEFAGTSFSSNLDDLEDAAAWLGEHYAPPQLLVGHSLGGTAALAVAGRLDSVRAVATIGAPATPEHVLEQFGAGLDRIEEHGCAKVELAGRSFAIRRDFIEDARNHDLSDRLKRLRRALLVMHSPVDDIVSIDEAQKIFVAALHPKSFISLDDADHLLSKAADSHYAGQVVAAWAARFLESAAAEQVDQLTVSGRTADGFLCRVQAGPHALLADEPEDKGGTDQGLDPMQFLATALGTCTVMTLNMYARHKKLPVERVSCEIRQPESGEFARRICIEGELDDAQRERMLEIAGRCPVHRTLVGEIRIRSELVSQLAAGSLCG